MITMNNRALLGIAVVVFAMAPALVVAQDRPIQLALVAPIQIFPESNSITGLRLNLLYGRNEKVTGIDLGLVNHTMSGESKGIQWGLVNITDADFTGLQDGWANVTKGNFEGLQWGVVNYANHANGLMVGLVNYAMTMKGLQIGLVNIIRQGGQFPVFPIVNWSF
jgi:hypothetical protein